MKTKKSTRPGTPRKRPTKRKTTRVTVDFLVEEHKILKARAALEGVTLQEYIRKRTFSANEEISNEVLKPIVKKIIDEHEDILKRLADK